jgi:hypothetical protein
VNHKGRAGTFEMKVPFTSAGQSPRPDREIIRTLEHMIKHVCCLISWLVAIKISLIYFYNLRAKKIKFGKYFYVFVIL